jgi:predicted esterase
MNKKLFLKITILSLLCMAINLKLSAQKTGVFSTSIMYGGKKHTIAYSVPVSYDQAKKHPMIVGLHGCGGAATDIRNGIKGFSIYHDAVVMCPDNFGNEISEFGLIKNAIDSAISLYNIDTTMIFLTGFSCNASEAIRLGLNHNYKFKGIMPWDPYTQGISNFNNYDVDMPIVIAAGNIDPSFNMDLKLYDSLKVHGSKINLVVAPGVAHELPSSLLTYMLRSYQFLVDSGNISIDAIPDIDILSTSPEQVVKLKNIKHKQNAELAVSSYSISSAVTGLAIDYSSGSDSATLTFKPGTISVNSKTRIIVEVKEKNGTGIKQIVINVAVRKKTKCNVSASSQFSFEKGPESAIDGNKASYWKSNIGNNEWLCVDLTKEMSVKGVVINWMAFGISYKIEVSSDSLLWTDAYTTATGAGKNETIAFDPVQARYIRMNGTESQNSNGYEIFEFQVDTGQFTGIKNSGVKNLNSQFELYPNILSNEKMAVTISYHLVKASSVHIVVYTIQGKEIKTLVNRNQPAGNYLLSWNILDNQVSTLSPGIYICKISTPDFQSQKKILLIR